MTGRVIEIRERPPIGDAVVVGINVGDFAGGDAGNASIVDERTKLDVEFRIGDGGGENLGDGGVLVTGGGVEVEVRQVLIALDGDSRRSRASRLGAK